VKERDSILAELLEIETLLADDQLKDEERAALHGAQQVSQRAGTGDMGGGLADLLSGRSPAGRGRHPSGRPPRNVKPAGELSFLAGPIGARAGATPE
jgi:hypothetical protein